MRSSPAARRTALALTRGDPSGIGLETALKAWTLTRGSEGSEPFFLVADVDHCRRSIHDLGLPVPLQACEPEDAAAIFATALPVVPLNVTTKGKLGTPDIEDAPGTILSIERSVELVAHHRATAVVTLPVAKEVLHRVGYVHPGQTEFMGELAGKLFDGPAFPVMLLWSPALAVVPLTIHIPLSSVPSMVTEALLAETVRVVDRELKNRFGVHQPRIAVAGLNPHAGEGGDIGREEIEMIRPALARLRADGFEVTGPHPADTLFHEAARATYDVAITMYHDQALIPIKTLAFDSAVNVTLGLPFVRTSPDHGTAFDIAGRGVANPASLIEALKLAGRLAAAGHARQDAWATT